MISHVYCYKRKSAGFAFNPIYSILEPKQYQESLSQNLYDMKYQELENYKDLELYYLGTFDNVSLKVDPKNDFMIDCASIACAAQATKKVEEPKNGKESN